MGRVRDLHSPRRARTQTSSRRVSLLVLLRLPACTLVTGARSDMVPPSLCSPSSPRILGPFGLLIGPTPRLPAQCTTCCKAVQHNGTTPLMSILCNRVPTFSLSPLSSLPLPAPSPPVLLHVQRAMCECSGTRRPALVFEQWM